MILSFFSARLIICIEKRGYPQSGKWFCEVGSGIKKRGVLY